MEKEKMTQLVTKMQAGDQEAASELYLACRDDLYYYILKTANDPHLAEDLLQDTFMEILQTIGKLNAPEAFVTWSRQIAYHRCTAYFRKRHELLADENEDGQTVFDTVEEDREEFIPDAALEKEDLKQIIAQMIADLPEEQRSALILRYYDELSLEEIAKVQNIPLGTVKSRLSYSRKMLKSAVESYEKKNGIKLHSVAILPLILWFFRQKAIAEGKSLTAKGAVAATAATETTVAAETVATETTAAAAPAATGAKTVATLGAKIAAKGLTAKIVAGVLAASLVVGAGVVVANLSREDEKNQETTQNNQGGYTSPEELPTPEDTPSTPQQTRPKQEFPTPTTSLVVNMNDYLIVEVDGYDGYGIVGEPRFDQQAFLFDVYPFITGLYTESTLRRTLEGADNHNILVFKANADNTGSTLSNGDTVSIHWEVNERGLKLLKKQLPNVEFKFEDTQIVVKDLPEIQTIDPFNCDGKTKASSTNEGSDISGQAVVTEWNFYFVDSSDVWWGMDIDVDEMGHEGYWSNGDQIKITINETDEFLLKQFGVILTTKTGIVTIDWLEEPSGQ